MRILRLLALLIVLPLCAHAQWTAYGISIPAGHPRLWNMNDSTWKSTALTYYNAHTFTTTEPFADAYKNVIGASGASCADGVSYLTTYTFPQPGSTGSDELRANGPTLVAIFDWCYSQLTAPQRATFISGMNGWLAQVVSTGWTVTGTYPQSNYFVGYFQVEMLWGIACYGETGCGSGAGSIADQYLLSAIGNVANPNVNTTTTAAISSTGSQSVAVASATGIAVNQVLLVEDKGANQELVQVTAISAGHFTANFVNTHLSGVAVQSLNYDRWYGYMVPFQNNTAPSGSLVEGTEYGSAIGAYPMMPLMTANFMSKNYYSDTNYFKALGYWLIYDTLPALTWNKTQSASYNAFFPYGDNEQFVNGDYLHQRSSWENFGHFLSYQYASINLGKYARTWLTQIEANDPCNDNNANSRTPCQWIQAQDPGGSSLALSGLPLDWYSGSDKGIFISRKAWDSTSTVAMWQMGYDQFHGLHQHYDVGNFQIWRKGTDTTGRWLTRESTGYSNVYAGYNGTGVIASDQCLAHNTVIINGQACPSDDDNKSATSIVRAESNTDYAYAAVDMTNLYKSTSASNIVALVSAVREYIFIRSLETVVVLDRIEVQSPDSGVTNANAVPKAFLLHSEVAQGSGLTLGTNTIDIVNGSEQLHATTLLPASATYTYVNENCGGSCSQDGSPQYRVELHDVGTGGNGGSCNTSHWCSYFVHVLQARDSSGSNYSVSFSDSSAGTVNSGTLTVTINSNTVVVFTKGQTSSGGTINVAGGGAVNLRSNVQGVSYTDSGPVWAGTPPTAPTGTLTPSVPAVRQGSTFALAWTSTGATSGSIDNSVGAVCNDATTCNAGGTTAVTANWCGARTYTLTLSGAGGTTPVTASVYGSCSGVSLGSGQTVGAGTAIPR